MGRLSSPSRHSWKTQNQLIKRYERKVAGVFQAQFSKNQLKVRFGFSNKDMKRLKKSTITIFKYGDSILILYLFLRFFLASKSFFVYLHISNNDTK